MTVYVDTSFLVSIYVRSPHSAAADALMLLRPEIYITPLTLAEWNHAIAAQVFRGQMSSSDAQQVELSFETDRASGVWFATALPEHAFEVCAELGHRHGPQLGIRTLDSLHVACALELKAERFWTFDERQAKLAKAQGMKTQ